MGWLTMITALVKFLGAVATYSKQMQSEKAGRTQVIALLLQRMSDDLQLAARTRTEFDRDLLRNPERLYDDDGYKRSGDG
ncbi:hypothetical protein [Polycladidibacter stylochi]|uniref:hypothetical protein n=1 Tax=Polycladidibacter stylochi TaxID=1807766 RepID=UPI000833B92F|nr:hypothetical protein [Pseudovibrio stylochi]